MSDPVQNVEIEDFLSSIRRLVTVDAGRPARKTARDIATDSLATAPAIRRDDKLVLTADLRIPDAEVDAAPSQTAFEPAQTHATEDFNTDIAGDTTVRLTLTLEQRIAELEAAVTAQAADYEPDGSEDTSQHRPSAVPLRRIIVQEIERSTASIDPDSDGAVDLETLVAHSMQAGVEERALPLVESGSHQTDPVPPTSSDAALDAADPQNTGSTLPEHQLFIHNPTRDHGPTEAVGSDKAPVSDGIDLASDEALLDEEALRDMVAEIVREELQGALGERITRNVRKLVRREIMRAISIRDFE